MASGRGTLAMQRLGVRLIEQRNPEDAIVLGDAMQEKGIDGLITGRSRPVVIRTEWTGGGNAQAFTGGGNAQALARITSQDEWNVIGRTQVAILERFSVQGYEVIYNVGRFAAKPDERRWGNIWTMWITPQRAIYRALVKAQLLPRTIRWNEIQWRSVPHLTTADVSLVYGLHLVRVPPRRKKPVDAYMFTVVRRDEDNPRVRGQHFDEEHR